MIAVCWGAPTKFELKRGLRPLQEIAAGVCVAHDVSLSDVVGPRRFRTISLARQEIYYRAKTEGGLSIRQIAHWFQRDHKGVSHGIKQFKERMKEGGNGAS